MGFWGNAGSAVQETVIDGAAGAVGAFAPPGYAEAGAAAIHGVGAGLDHLEGHDDEAKVEVASAGAAAIPSAGRVAGALDMAQAVYNADVAYNRSQGTPDETSGHILADANWSGNPNYHPEGQPIGE